MSPDQATTTVIDEAKAQIPVFSVHFIPIDNHTTFRAEVAITEGDIVFHFFVNEEIKAMPDPKKYWMETFPNALSQVAEEHFQATFPRLKAAYTEEQASWWMRAYGFGQLLEPHKFAYAFFDKLDAALDSALGATPTHA